MFWHGYCLFFLFLIVFLLFCWTRSRKLGLFCGFSEQNWFCFIEVAVGQVDYFFVMRIIFVELLGFDAVIDVQVRKRLGCLNNNLFFGNVDGLNDVNLL